MVARIWEDKYPEGTETEISYDKYKTVLDVFHDAVNRFADRPAYTNMGQTITYGELDQYSADFAAFLQQCTPLKQGDRIAVQMPNILQYPIAVFGAMRAGMVIVNTNPLYTEREMEHQFIDAGCKGLVVMANFCDLVEEALPKTAIETVIVTEIADMHSPFKRFLINNVVKYVKKMVPSYSLPNAISFRDAMKQGAKAAFDNSHDPQHEDLAVLQYTGGTTGVAKGAMLTHRNLVSNMMQFEFVISDVEDGKEICIAPLPMYHIFSFTVNCLGMMTHGAHNILITNPRDIPAFIKELKKWQFSAFTGLNTLFVALMNQQAFRDLDFSHLKLTVAGGMALQSDTAKRWEKLTGHGIAEGYGMTETSPVVTVNPPHAIQVGSIGIPLPGTDVKVIDEQENELPFNEPGELCVKGPQVMAGYYLRDDETRKTFTRDGEWLKTGDVAVIQEDGYLRIVDRLKDMILVSGFNVYPNEVEDVLCTHPDIIEAAAVGIPDERSGEAIKVFLVTKDNKQIPEKELVHLCRESLTGYKVPHHFEYRTELPKSNVGKILRRQLRD